MSSEDKNKSGGFLGIRPVMNLMRTLCLSAIAVILLITRSGTAQFFDFEDDAVPPGNITTDGDIVSNGFLFDSAIDHLHRSNARFTDEVDSGSTYLVIHDYIPGNSLTVSPVAGGTF